MIGLTSVSVFGMIMICILVLTFMIDRHINRNSRSLGVPTAVTCVILLVVGVIFLMARSVTLHAYREEEQFKDPLVVRNDTQDVLLVKVREETMLISRTFETAIPPGDVAYFSSTTGYYRLLNTRRLDDGDVASRYDKLSKD